VWWRALAPQAQGAGANPAMIKPEA
jgi:hypothetical protein